jgi:predicted Zn-dependent peptidase
VAADPIAAEAATVVAVAIVAGAEAARDVDADVSERPAAAADAAVRRTVLPSGVRVVTERMPDAKSVATGIWVGVGSRDESDELAGASHFLEHLLFKGTETRTARSIATSVDAVGGEMNAFTAREHTAFYTRLPVDQLKFGLELLVDVVTGPAFRPAEVEAEREVILEELFMSEDAPDDVAVTALFESLFPEHGLGRETLGTRTSISDLSRDSIAAFHRDHYRPANLVVAAAGDLHHDDVVDSVEALGAMPDPSARPHRSPPSTEPVGRRVLHRPTEQAHVAMGWRGLHFDHPDRYALWVANHVTGGGMSSRLFQEVREERGLAYTVYTAPATYQDCGALSLYAGTSPNRLDELFAVIDEVIRGLLADGITREELEVAVGFLRGSMLLGLEDSGSRMSRLGAGQMNRDEIIPVEEHLARIQAVTLDDVDRVLHTVFDEPGSVVVVGPVDDREVSIAAP